MKPPSGPVWERIVLCQKADKANTEFINIKHSKRSCNCIRCTHKNYYDNFNEYNKKNYQLTRIECP